MLSGPTVRSPHWRERGAIRAVKETGSLPPGGVEVVGRGGEYRPTEPLALSAEGSGTTEAWQWSEYDDEPSSRRYMTIRGPQALTLYARDFPTGADASTLRFAESESEKGGQSAKAPREIQSADQSALTDNERTDRRPGQTRKVARTVRSSGSHPDQQGRLTEPALLVEQASR